MLGVETMTHTEYMESIEQLTIFDLLTVHEPQVSRKLQVGDDVKIVLPCEKENNEAYNYLYYYYPHVVGKIARIVEVAKTSYKVCVNGEYLLLTKNELEIV